MRVALPQQSAPITLEISADFSLLADTMSGMFIVVVVLLLRPPLLLFLLCIVSLLFARVCVCAGFYVKVLFSSIQQSLLLNILQSRKTMERDT